MKKSRELSRVVQATPGPEDTAPPTLPCDGPGTPSRARRCALVAVGAVLIAMGIILTYWWNISDPDHRRLLGAGDCWSFCGPVLHFLDHRIHHGELPLWNPLYHCGQPHAANPQAWVFYPPNLVRSLLSFNPTPMKTHVGIALMIFFHLLFAGVSMLLLARRHGLSFGASLVASFGFTFSAALVARAVGHWVFLNTTAWLPLLLLLLRQAMITSALRNKVCLALAAGVVWGMAILGGIPHLMMIVGLTAAAYALLFRILYPLAGVESIPSFEPVCEIDVPEGSKKKRVKNKKPAAPKRRSRVRPIAKLASGILTRDAVVLCLLFATGILVAAPLLFPGAQFSSYTGRGSKDEAMKEEPVQMSGLWHLVKILAVYQGHGDYEGPRAAGAIVLMLALAAVVCRPRRDMVMFAALFLILLDCSIPQPLLFGRLVARLAPFVLSNPGRAMIITCLPLGLLAGAGTDAVLAPLASWRWRTARSGAVLLLGAAIVLIVALAERPEPVLAVGNLAVVLPIIACLVAAVAGWVPRFPLWGIVLAALVFGETLAWNRELIPSIDEVQQYKGSLDAMRQPKTFWSDNRRGTYLEPNVPMYELEPAMNGYDPLQIREVRDILCITRKQDIPRMIQSAQVTEVSMRGNLFLKRQFWLARQYVDGPLPDRNTPFPAATTVFLEDPGDLPLPQVDAASLPRTGVSKEFSPLWIKPQGSPPQVLRSEDFTETSNACALPPITLPALHSSLFVRLSSTCKMEVIPLFQDIKTKREEFGKGMNLKAGDGTPESFEVPLPDFQEIKISFVPDFRKQTGQFSVLDLLIGSDLNDEDGLISVASRTANTVAVDLRDLPGDRMLVCVDAFYPGWHAYVDGRPAYIYKADGAFKGVMVPRGSHRVTFVFKPFLVLAGMLVSVLTLAGIAAALVLLLKKFRGIGPAAPTVSANTH